jgi:hypothetical protein
MFDSISARHLRDILERNNLWPLRHKYWSTGPDRGDADFGERVTEICDMYQEAHRGATRHDQPLRQSACVTWSDPKATAQRHAN